MVSWLSALSSCENFVIPRDIYFRLEHAVHHLKGNLYDKGDHQSIFDTVMPPFQLTIFAENQVQTTKCGQALCGALVFQMIVFSKAFII